MYVDDNPSVKLTNTKISDDITEEVTIASLHIFKILIFPRGENIAISNFKVATQVDKIIKNR